MAIRILLIITGVLIMLGCSSKKQDLYIEQDLYSMRPEDFSSIKSFGWIREAWLYNYKKNGNFDSLVSKQKIEIKDTIYIESLNKSYFLTISEVNYHYDFVLILTGGKRNEMHKFSKIKIEKFETGDESGSKRLHYDLITEYVYNTKLYKGQECNFVLDRPITSKSE